MRARSGLQSAAQANVPVVFFPEGTASNGATAGKFHSRILGKERDTGQPVTAAFVGRIIPRGSMLLRGKSGGERCGLG